MSPAVFGNREPIMVAVLRMPRHIESDQGAERRMFPRKVVHTRVDSVRMDHSIQARRQPQVSLALRDLSLGGISAISGMPLEAGERLTVFFPPQGSSRGWD